MARFSSLLCILPTALAAFTHPGLLVTDADITRAQTKIEAGLDPWLSSWNDLISLEYASASYVNNAAATVARDTNGSALWHDAAAAFDLALRWRISGNDTFADTASDILVAWADTLEALTGSDMDDYLTAGLQGAELANAAEILRDYAPFEESGLSAVTTMLTSIFLPMNVDFINHVLSAEHNVLHYFANWELCNLNSIMSIAVLSDNETLWDFAIDYLQTGSGNGNINKAVSNIVADPDTGASLGQGQESGRDQGHTAMDYQLLASIGQQAWNQGEDLFSFNDSRILLGAEYFARYNLGYDVPFENYTNGIVFYTEISSSSRGAIRPTWELLYNHYVQIKGLDAPWTTEYLNSSLTYFGGYEGGAGSWGEGSGHYDGLGWGSLLYHMDESDLANATATASASVSAATAAAASSAVSSSAAATSSAVSTAIAAAADTSATSAADAISTAATAATAASAASAAVDTVSTSATSAAAAISTAGTATSTADAVSTAVSTAVTSSASAASTEVSAADVSITATTASSSGVKAVASSATTSTAEDDGDRCVVVYQTMTAYV